MKAADPKRVEDRHDRLRQDYGVANRCRLQRQPLISALVIAYNDSRVRSVHSHLVTHSLDF